MMPQRTLATARGARSASRIFQFSTTTRLPRRYEFAVETPLQSQSKDSVAPSTAARPEAEALTSETPLQKQRREALAPSMSQAKREKSHVLPPLLAGMIAIPPIVYYYYEYRREHMDNKRAILVEQQRQKYANGG